MSYSVCQFFKDGEYEYVRRGVDFEEARKAFWHYTTNVAAKFGLVPRVIILDDSDYILVEWRHGKGVVCPEH